MLVSGRVFMKEANIRKGMRATPWHAITTNIAPRDLRLHKYEDEFQICTPLKWFTWKSAPGSLEMSFGNHHFTIPFVELWGWKILFRCKAVKKIRVSQKSCKLAKVSKTFLKRPACVVLGGKGGVGKNIHNFVSNANQRNQSTFVAPDEWWLEDSISFRDKRNLFKGPFM